jgi:hypothetical protein
MNHCQLIVEWGAYSDFGLSLAVRVGRHAEFQFKPVDPRASLEVGLASAAVLVTECLVLPAPPLRTGRGWTIVWGKRGFWPSVRCLD